MMRCSRVLVVSSAPFLAMMCVAFAVMACWLAQAEAGPSPTRKSDSQATGSSAASRSKKGVPMKIEITSTAFADGQAIPKKHTGEGSDVSPALSWKGVPKEAKELVLICDDPDAPTKEPWVHWVIYKIPADATGLPEGVPRQPKLKSPAGVLQGKNSWPQGQNNVGYRGPLPPPGKPHRYYFKLYAIDAHLTAEAGLEKKALLETIRGHVLAEGQLMGTYQR